MKNLKMKKLLLIGMAIIIAIAISVPLIARTGHRDWFPEIFEDGVAFWQYPRYTGAQSDYFITGPLPDGSGDQDAIIQTDPKFNPDIVPLIVKQLPASWAGTVHGTMHRHKDPQLIGWFSTNVFTGNSADEKDLCGTVTVYIGEEMEQHSFNNPTLLYIPANVPHGVVVYGNDMKRPITYLEAFCWGKKGPEKPCPQLHKALPDFTQGLPDKSGNPPGGQSWNPAGGGIYGQYFFTGLNPNSAVNLPASQVRVLPFEIPGVDPKDGITFIFTKEAAASDPTAQPRAMHFTHAHLYDEYLFYLSTDPDDLHNLGMTIRDYHFNRETHMMEGHDYTKPFLQVNLKKKHLNTPLLYYNKTRANYHMNIGLNFDPMFVRDYTLPAGNTFKGKDYVTAEECVMAFQFHSPYYTNGLFDYNTYGIPPEDQPMDPYGKGGFLVEYFMPHTFLSCTYCHGVTVPPL